MAQIFFLAANGFELLVAIRDARLEHLMAPIAVFILIFGMQKEVGDYLGQEFPRLEHQVHTIEAILEGFSLLFFIWVSLT